MFPTPPELRFAPGTRVRVTHNVRVGGKCWRTQVEGVVELEGYRPVGGMEMGGKASYCFQPTIRLRRDDGEVTVVALDDDSRVEEVPAEHRTAHESDAGGIAECSAPGGTSSGHRHRDRGAGSISMKTCPFCREEIRDDAVKCRYCASSLLPSQSGPEGAAATPAPGPDQAVYIVDKSLIRFGKFIGAVLTLFALVGGVLWGFKINEASDRVRDDADLVRKALADISDMQWKIRDYQDQVHKTNQKILAAAGSVEENRTNVEKALAKSQEALAKSQEALTKSQETLAASKLKADELLIAIKAHEREAVGILRTYQLKFSSPGKGPSLMLRSPSSVVTTAPLSVSEIAKLYDFPTEFDGKGQTIGLIELGDGYSDSDLDAYFARLKLTRPKVTSVFVGGARNQPGKTADAQVTLDIEVAGAVAPGAHIVVYFAPNTKKGFLEAVTAAAHDEANRPSILCISWGSPESTWSSAMLNSMDATFRTAGLLGMTVVTAAGDGGVTDGIADGEDHVDFPASSPYVLAVGGTRLVRSGSKITSEVGWNDRSGSATGGGFSAVFPRPDWQSGVNVPARKGRKPGRGIPDVAANAAPDSGYLVYIDGQATQVGGTSASGPLWAGLIALINQGVGRKVGYINQLLYNKLGPDGVFRDITEGNNGTDDVEGYTAGPGWDACTGWGSPSGRKLLAAFRSQ